MNLATFDKLAYIDSLKANGVPEDQARAHAVALDTALHEAVATKADMADVKGLIADVRSEISEVRADMQTALADVRSEISEVRVEISEVRVEISEVRVEIAASRSETLRWVFGMFLAQAALMVAAMAALIKLL